MTKDNLTYGNSDDSSSFCDAVLHPSNKRRNERAKHGSTCGRGVSSFLCVGNQGPSFNSNATELTMQCSYAMKALLYNLGASFMPDFWPHILVARLCSSLGIKHTCTWHNNKTRAAILGAWAAHATRNMLTACSAPAEPLVAEQALNQSPTLWPVTRK